MKLIKEFISDARYPSNDEVKECLKIVDDENCIIKLQWKPTTGSRTKYTLTITKGMTFEECVNNINSTRP